MSDAFISYSRQDTAFVKRLAEYLSQQELQCWMDSADLPAGEIWRKELQDAIIASASFLFVVSPASLQSSYCGEELAFAAHHNKRMIPLLLHQPTGDPALPEELSKWQTITLDEAQESATFASVTAAIRREYQWHRQGSDYQKRAQRWENGIEIFLVREELEDARDWIERGARIRPGPTSLQLRYIQASEAHHLREAERWQALYTRALARQLAAQARMILEHGDPALSERGMLLALEASERFQQSGQWTLEADQVLRAGLATLANPLFQQLAQYPIARGAVAANPVALEFAYGDKQGQVVRVDHRGAATVIARLDAAIHCLSYSDDGQLLGAGAADGGILVLRQAQPLPLDSNDQRAPVTDICFSQGGNLIAVAGGQWVRVWDLQNPKSAVVLENPEGGGTFCSLSFDPSGEILIAQVAGEDTLVWRWREQRLHRRLETQGLSLSHSRDGRYLGICTMHYKAALWDVYEQQQHLISDSAVKLRFSADGKWVAIASPHHYVQVWELPGLNLVQRLQHSAEVWDLCFSPDRNVLLTRDKHNLVHVWDVGRKQVLARIIPRDATRHACFLAGSQYLLTLSGEQRLIIWDVLNLHQAAMLRHQVAVTGVAFAPGDNARLATAARVSPHERSYTLIDWNSAQPLERYRLDTEEIAGTEVAQRLLERRQQPEPLSTQSPDGKLRIQQSENKLHITSCTSSTDAQPPATDRTITLDRTLLRVEFSPDSQHLLTLCDHDTARVWNVQTGVEVARLTHENPNLTDATFSDDGRYIATASWDGTARVWLWRPADLVGAAVARVGRSLTPEEWTQYLPDEEYQPVVRAPQTNADADPGESAEEIT